MTALTLSILSLTPSYSLISCISFLYRMEDETIPKEYPPPPEYETNRVLALPLALGGDVIKNLLSVVKLPSAYRLPFTDSPVYPSISTAPKVSFPYVLPYKVTPLPVRLFPFMVNPAIVPPDALRLPVVTEPLMVAFTHVILPLVSILKLLFAVTTPLRFIFDALIDTASEL